MLANQLFIYSRYVAGGWEREIRSGWSTWNEFIHTRRDEWERNTPRDTTPYCSRPFSTFFPALSSPVNFSLLSGRNNSRDKEAQWTDSFSVARSRGIIIRRVLTSIFPSARLSQRLISISIRVTPFINGDSAFISPSDFHFCHFFTVPFIRLFIYLFTRGFGNNRTA